MNDYFFYKNLVYLCLATIAIAVLPAISFGQTENDIEKEKAKLKNQIVQQELEIQAERLRLMSQKKVRREYEEQARKLDMQVQKANKSIRERARTIQSLNESIKNKNETIRELDEKVRREKASLSQLLRRTRELDDISLVEIILGGKTFSETLVNVDRFDFIKNALKASFDEIYDIKNTLMTEKEKLQQAQRDQEELKMIQEREKEDVLIAKKEKEELIRLSKSKERTYQESIKEKEKRVAQIRARLFELRDSNAGAVSFGKMLEYAKEAGKKTDVHPALILAILTVETNLGKNLGVGKWDEDMHPTRDVPIFKQIVSELGLDPDKVPVSARPCSAEQRKAVGPGKPCGYGYGGAMGPAQFIPSTWILYKDRIARLSGQNPPNPWDPRTAVFATALLMMDNGADKGTRYAEHKAAVRYLAGWRNAEKKEYWWYGDKTMKYRDKYAKDIEALEY